MKTYHIPIIASFIFVSSQLAASGVAELEKPIIEKSATDSKVAVEWIEPKKFRDVKHASMSKKRYRETVFAELEEYFTLLAQQLPEGQKLNITVTDLDLAGTVQSLAMAGLNNYSHNLNFSLNDYRIMRDVDIPRMTFSYELIDQKDQVIRQQEVKLKDMSFLSRANVVRGNETLRYEKAMISRWFLKTFERES